MKVQLIRTKHTDDGVFGSLIVDGQEMCVTGESADKFIQPGVYKCDLRASPKFGLTYELQDVPGRTHILIHAGNFCGSVEKKMKHDCTGCILLGTKYGELDGQFIVANSRKAVDRFMKYAVGKAFEIEIVENYV